MYLTASSTGFGQSITLVFCPNPVDLDFTPEIEDYTVCPKVRVFFDPPLISGMG